VRKDANQSTPEPSGDRDGKSVDSGALETKRRGENAHLLQHCPRRHMASRGKRLGGKEDNQSMPMGYNLTNQTTKRGGAKQSTRPQAEEYGASYSRGKDRGHTQRTVKKITANGRKGRNVTMRPRGTAAISSNSGVLKEVQRIARAAKRELENGRLENHAA